MWKSLRIMHWGSILINGNVRMGENASLYINTCFVAGGNTDEVSTVGNNVVCGVGGMLV